MERHALFSRIWMHSDEELADALGANVVERETIHEWPLSCVQRLVLDRGEKLVYKAQLPPTIEASFYEEAVSPLLTGHRVLAHSGECITMTLDWIDVPSLRDAVMPEAEWLMRGRELSRCIQEIRTRSGSLPSVYLNIGSEGAWFEVVDTVLKSLARLLFERRSRSLNASHLKELRQWAESPQVCACIAERPALLHGDLKASQIFLNKGEYRLIDWQRPMVGPPDLDIVSLLLTQRIDPRAFVKTEAVGIFWFLFLRWAVLAQAELFGEFRGGLFNRWATVAVRQILDVNAPMPPVGVPPA